MTTDALLAPLLSLNIPDRAQLSSKALALREHADGVVVDCQDMFEVVALDLQAIKERWDLIEKMRVSITGPLNQATKAANDIFREPLRLLAEAERTIKAKMLAYQVEQERIAAETRRRAEEAAAAERRRLEDEARAARERAAAEERALAEQAAAAAAAGNARAAAEAERRRQTAAQNAALEVRAIEQTASVIVAAPPAVEPPRAAGISVAKSVQFEVSDLHALIVHVAQHPELDALLMVDTVRLRAYVRGLGMNTRLPGVRLFEAKTMRAA